MTVAVIEGLICNCYKERCLLNYNMESRHGKFSSNPAACKVFTVSGLTINSYMGARDHVISLRLLVYSSSPCSPFQT